MKKLEKEKVVKNEDDEIKIFEKIKNLDVEHKKLICLYVIIIILIFQTVQPYLPKINFSSKKEEPLVYDVSSFKEIRASQLDTVLDKEKVEILYIGRSGCDFCLKMLPILKQAQSDYHYITNYIDMDKVTEEDREKILSLDNETGFIKQHFGGTPMILSIKDSKLVQGWVGYAEYSAYREFLAKSGL